MSEGTGARPGEQPPFGDVDGTGNADGAPALDDATTVAGPVGSQVPGEQRASRRASRRRSVPDLLGPYYLVRELGTGGMGTVHLARVANEVGEAETGLGTGDFVAVKVMHTDLALDESVRRRFTREADVGRTVRHPNVVRTYATGLHEDDFGELHYLVLEYVEGQTLRGLGAELDTLPEELCRHVGAEIARGLAAIHAGGAVHRDLKPENVLITLDQSVRIMDFGIAKPLHATSALTTAGEFAGSLSYAAPEQFAENEPITPATDLWALGVLLYELASGSRPFAGGGLPSILKAVLRDTPRQLGTIAPHVSEFFEEVVHQLLSKDPGERFASASDVADVLAQGEASDWWSARVHLPRRAVRRRPPRAPRDTALFGRDEELAALHRAFEQAKSGAGRVMLVTGEAGIGKTRLVDEFVSELEAAGEPIAFLAGSFPPGGAATAAGAFRSAFREHFGDADLEQRAAQHLTAAPALAPAFAALLRGENAPAGAAALDAESLQTVFIEASRSVSATSPAVLLVEDLQFAPAAGRALFAALAAALGSSPILLVGTLRPGVVDPWVAELEHQEQVSLIRVGRLGARDLSHLLEEALRSADLAERLGTPIARKSDGNPFFAFEILRALREESRIVRGDDGVWTSAGTIERIEIPSSVRDLIEARVADLSEDERDLLDVAACCGFRFDPLLVGQVVGLQRIAVLKRLARIERAHRLVRADGRQFVFDHHQVQEALHESQPEMLREEYHGAIADVLIDTASQQVDAVPGDLAVRVCHHCLRGARGAQAVPYLGAALDHLDAAHRNEAAADLAGRALSVEGLLRGRERAELLLRVADRTELLGWREQERAYLDEARALAGELGDCDLSSRADCALIDYLRRVSEFDEAFVIARGALADAEESGELVLQARAWRRLVWLEHLRGEIDDALAAVTRQMAIAQRSGDRAELSAAEAELGIILHHLGRPDEARTHYVRRLELSRELGDVRAEAAAAGNLGNLLRGLGDLVGAREQHERNIALAREIGARQSESHARGNLGNVVRDLGRTADALTHFGRSLTLARELGDRRHESICRFNTALAYLRIGAHEEAHEHFLAADALAREIALALLEASVRHGLAALAYDQGLLSEAALELSAAEEQFGAIGYRAGLPELLVLRGQIDLARGEPDSARTQFEQAETLSRELRQSWIRMVAVAERAALPGGDPLAAQALVVESEASAPLHARLQARHALWRATADEGHLRVAHRQLLLLQEAAPEPHRAAVLERVPLHRAIIAAINAR